MLMVTIRSWLLQQRAGIPFHSSNNCRARQTSMGTRFTAVSLCMQAVCPRWISGTVWLYIQVTLGTLRICCLIVSRKKIFCPSGCCEEISLKMGRLGNQRSFSIRKSKQIQGCNGSVSVLCLLIHFLDVADRNKANVSRGQSRGPVSTETRDCRYQFLLRSPLVLVWSSRRDPFFTWLYTTAWNLVTDWRKNFLWTYRKAEGRI